MPAGTNSEILAATANAANSTVFSLGAGESSTVLCTPNLEAGEVAAVQVSPDGGTTWVNYLDVEPVELSWLKNAVNLIGPAHFRVAKGATNSPVAIRLQA